MTSRLAEATFEEVDGETLYANVTGEIDGSNAAELRRAIGDRVQSATRMLILDLAQVTYVDSAGVELLFELARRLDARRQVLGVIAPSGSGVRRVLELCDVGSVATLSASRDEALASSKD